MTLTTIPKKWKQDEVNEYFNIRLNTIERMLQILITNFSEIIPDEDAVNSSSVLSAAVKDELLGVLNEVKDKVKKEKKNKD
jgi:hypothetical protein